MVVVVPALAAATRTVVVVVPVVAVAPVVVAVVVIVVVAAQSGSPSRRVRADRRLDGRHRLGGHRLGGRFLDRLFRDGRLAEDRLRSRHVGNRHVALGHRSRVAGAGIPLVGLGIGDRLVRPTRKQHYGDREEDGKSRSGTGCESPRVVTQGVEGGHVSCVGRSPVGD
jgi:hypothetical protein